MAKTFTDSNNHEWLLCYGICSCYVWLTVWEYVDFGGCCGRCGDKVKLLNPIIDYDEALEIYKEVNGTYPEPMK